MNRNVGWEIEWKDTPRIIIQISEIRFEDMDWIELAQDSAIAGICDNGVGPFDCITTEKVTVEPRFRRF
jgi:hypothetical protein